MESSTKKTFAVAALLVIIAGLRVTIAINNHKDKPENNKVNIEVQKESAIVSNNTNMSYNEYVKSYYDIKSVKLNAGFDFKLPDYIANESRPVIYHIRKISDKNNAVQIVFDNEVRAKTGLSVFMFKEEPKESIKLINETRTNKNSNFKTEVQENPMKSGNIAGKDIILTTTNIKNDDEQYTNKYFVWYDSGVYYAIEYSDIVVCNDSVFGDSISNDEVEKMAASFKNLQDIKNINYDIKSKEASE